MLLIQEYLKNLEQSNDESFPDDIIEYDESFPDDIIEYEVVEMKLPSKATREHDLFLKAYLEKMDTKPTNAKEHTIQRKPLKSESEKNSHSDKDHF